jgi:hypothetical protein
VCWDVSEDSAEWVRWRSRDCVLVLPLSFYFSFVLSGYICREWVCNDWLSVVVALVNRPRTTLVVQLSFVNQVALLFVLASSATWRYVWGFLLSCVLPLFLPSL